MLPFQKTQKNINHEDYSLNLQTLSLSKYYRWRRIGASLALAGYLNQILCPFMVVSGLIFTTPLEAMDGERPYKMTGASPRKSSKGKEELKPSKDEDQDLQTAINLSLEKRSPIVKPRKACLPQSNDQDRLTFSTPRKDHSQRQEHKPRKKASSLRAGVAPCSLKIDNYHQQHLGAQLKHVLGVEDNPQDILSKITENLPKNAPSIPSVTFHSEYCQQGKITQATALDILQVNEHDYPVKTPKFFSGYCFAKISHKWDNDQVQWIDFSYAERLSHYAFHSALFDQGTLFGHGVLPVGLLTLENVFILEKRQKAAIDAHLGGWDTVPYSYAVQVQAQPQTQGTLDQLLATNDGLKQISSESLSTLIISHLLTGSKAPLQEYGLLSNESDGKLHLVLPASAHGVYPVITKITRGEQVFHISHLASDLFLTPELMNQPLAPSVAKKLTDLIPEIVVLDWLAKLQKSNDFYQQWQNNGSLSFEAFLDSGLPLGVVRGMPFHLCSTLYKIQSCLNKDLRSTHDTIFQSLFPALHAAYAYQRKEVDGAKQKSSASTLEANTGSQSLEEVLKKHAGPHGRLPDGRYAHDLLRAETAKEFMPLQKVADAAQDLIDGINLHKLKNQKKKKILLTKIAQEFLEEGLHGKHPSWSDASFWQELLFDVNDPDLLKLVLGRGAKIKAPDEAGNYVLHTLLKAPIPLEQLKDCLTVLVKHNEKLDQEDKLKLDQKNEEGLTALDIILTPEYPTLEKAASLFAHFINLEAGRPGATLPQEEKIVEFYHKIRKAGLWPSVQEAFQTLQYHHPKLSWALAVSEILPKDKEPTISEVLERLRQSLNDLKNRETQLKTGEDVDGKKASNLREFKKKITTLALDLESLEDVQSNPQEFEEILNSNPHLKKYCQTQENKIRGITLGERTLPEEVKNQLWDKDKNFKPVNTHGRRDVGRAELNGHVLYFKRYPELPGFEYAMDVLHHQVIGYGTPWSDLVRMRDEPFLVSLGIQGDNLHDLLNQTPDKDPEVLSQLETKSLQKLILMAMLTNPEDQKPDQFIVEKMVGHQDSKGNHLLRLVCVDNDHALAPSVAKIVKENYGLKLMDRNPTSGDLNQIRSGELVLYLKGEENKLFCKIKEKEEIELDNNLSQIPADLLSKLKQNITIKNRPKELDWNQFIGFLSSPPLSYLENKTEVRVKSILYCLPQMKEVIDEEVRKLFENISFIFKTLKEWLNQIQKVDDLYHNGQNPLFTHSQTKELLDRIDGPDSFVAGIPFRDNMIHKLCDRWLRLQSILDPHSQKYKKTKNDTLTLAWIFERLEPEIWGRYAEGFESVHKNGSVLKRFLFVDGASYKVTNNTFRTTLSTRHFINSLNIPVNLDVLESKRKKDDPFSSTLRLEELDLAEKNHQLQIEKKAEATKFKYFITGEEKSSFLKHYTFQGKEQAEQKIIIDHLKELEENKSENSPRQLYLQHCSVLTDQTLGNIALTNVTHLNVSGCSNLTGTFLSDVSLHAKHLLYLIMRGLDKIQCLKSHQNQGIEFQKLNSLDVSQCPKLKTIQLNAPRLQKLSASDCVSLSEIKLSPTPELISLNLHSAKEVSEADFSAILAQSQKLKKVQLQGCDKIPYAKIIELDPSYPVALLEKCTPESKPRVINAIEEILGDKRTLKQYGLAWRKIEDAGILCLLPALASNTILTSLILQNNAITDAGVKDLSTNTTLKELILGLNQITDTGAADLAANTTLTSLELSWNKITDAGAKAFAVNTTLKKLILIDNHITDTGAKDLSINTTLTSLNLWGNQITDVGVKDLVANTTLKKLILIDNHITDTGAKDLSINTTLTSLNLSGNQITDVGVKDLAANTTLTSLDLSRNQITDTGAKDLAANTTLTSLNLSRNQITDVGVKDLAANTTLKELILDDNHITDVGVKDLAANTTLTSLNLCRNQITDEGSKNLKSNTTLTLLHFYGNQITDTEYQWVQKIISHNKIKKVLERYRQLNPQIDLSQSVLSKDENLLVDSPPQLPLTGTLHGTLFQFDEKDLPIDNDCGFHGLHLDRNSAVQQLLRSKGNPEIRALVAPEIKAAFIEGNIPTPMRGTWYNRLHQAYHQGTPSPEVAQELDTYSNDPTNYSFFIREYLGGGGSLIRKLGATSTMDALAKLNHLTVHIWQRPSSQDSALKLLCSTEAYGKSIIHLLRNSQGAHSRLEAIAVPPAFSKLPFEPQISLFAIKELLPHIHHMDSFIQSLSSKMEQYYDKTKDEEFATVQNQWQQSLDQLKSTLINTNQALMDTTQDLQTKTNILDAQNVFYTGLSIDGGGVRGLIPAIMLQKLERKARKYTKDIHIHQMFDYIGGTSVGGILALGLTAPKEEGAKQPLRTLDEMVTLFKEKGPIIFQRTFWGGTGGKVINGIAGAALGIFAGPLGMAGGGFVGSKSHDLLKPKFTAEGLEGLLHENFDTLRLSETLIPIVVTAVNHTKAPLEGFFFDTLMARNSNGNHDFLMKDVGRATSAAQSYFPEACIWNLSKSRSYKFSDGGPFCNNPSNAVYNKIVRNFDHVTHKNVRMISFGTGESKPEYDIPTMQGMKGQGELGWMKPLIYGQMNLSSFWVDFSMQETLGSNYIRLQPRIVDQLGHLKDADLADYSPQLLDEYVVLATETFDKYISEDFIRKFTEERAQKKDPF